MGWDVLKERVLRGQELDSEVIHHLDFARQEIFVEDLVSALRDRRDGQYEPVFVGIVLLLKIDSRWNVEILEVVEQLLDQDEFAWRGHAFAEDDLRLLKREDLTLLDQFELLSVMCLLDSSGKYLPYLVYSSQYAATFLSDASSAVALLSTMSEKLMRS